MLYIQKERTPEIIKQAALAIAHTPDSGYDAITLPKDSEQLRKLFDQMPKDEIRKALCREQHGLCAYCMRRIKPDFGEEEGDFTKIEHYIPLSQNKERALDYQNYLGVCFGGQHDDRSKPYILCCDASRKEKELTINLWDRRQMEAIAYERSGKIYVRRDAGLDKDLVDAMEKDIKDALVLNGVVDDKGRACEKTYVFSHALFVCQ